MSKIWKAIDGWKTELGLLAFATASILLKMEQITPEQFEWAMIPIAGWTGVAIKHAVKKSTPKAQ